MNLISSLLEFLRHLESEGWGWLGSLIVLAIAAVAALILHVLVFWVGARVAKRTGWAADDKLLRRLRGPSRVLLPLLALVFALPATHLSGGALEVVGRTITLGLIASVVYLIISILGGLEDIILSRYRVDVRDNLRARKIHTQIHVLRRTLVIVVIILGIAAMLMTFPRVRELGASILASAGVAGLVLGLAARPTVENLIAGMQLAMTEPIRLDDVVIVEGEWGRIEEITATYVVVAIWDERRLIVPFSSFISKPFQNWTRKSAELLGTVYFYADYTVPVEEVRSELRRIAEASEKWDRRVCGLVVTNCTEHTLEMRALVSAADSGKAWDLRCEVREKLVAYLQREHPQCLPRVRAELGEKTPSEEQRA